MLNGQSLPTPSVVQGMERPWEGVLLEDRAKAVAARVITPPALPLGGGGDGAGGMPKKAYRMLMAMLVPKFVERRERRRAREGVGGPAVVEAAATVAGEEDDDGVEESKGKGSNSWRGRRESGDVKAWAAAVGGGLKGVEGAMAAVALNGGCAVADAFAGAGGDDEDSGRGRLMRQLKAQSQSRRGLLS